MSDVIWRPQGIVIVPRATKTDQEGEDTAKAVEPAKNTALCPVLALKAWMDAADITTGPVFRPITARNKVISEHLSTRSFRRNRQEAGCRRWIHGCGVQRALSALGLGSQPHVSQDAT